MIGASTSDIPRPMHSRGPAPNGTYPVRGMGRPGRNSSGSSHASGCLCSQYGDVMMSAFSGISTPPSSSGPSACRVISQAGG